MKQKIKNKTSQPYTNIARNILFIEVSILWPK